ncbi:hypothetical protein GXW78_15775 [Roseomonas terrae]|uniref:Uncharacterized protein n=1 Tax=Neoroseomonas terrae TaxID=424799 RepID=A0ABS5EJC9_9PROT|nr:hypothetical protein [Neoroseomonas terrae]MBR0651131.1 hypothetical protein [Neoroseomonas terrae]
MDGMELKPGWWCWLEAPVVSPGWGASPILLQHVEPLKTGKGLLRLHLVQPIHPIAARERVVVLRVLFRGDRHLTGTMKDDDGTIRTVIVAMPDYGWLETYCPILMRRRPPAIPTFSVVGQPPLPGPTATEHLDAIFGRTPARILRGASADSFGNHHPPMPARQGSFSLDRTYPPFDAWMIARGFVPTVMEEKWFIYLEGGRLLFRRSWTGILVYEVEAGWRGDELHLGQVRVNRDPEQYGETQDDHDRRLLAYLITVVLLGDYAPFPTKEAPGSEEAALQAWSQAGKASLP